MLRRAGAEVLTSAVNRADGEALLGARRARDAKQTRVRWTDRVRRARALRLSCEQRELRPVSQAGLDGTERALQSRQQQHATLATP